MNESNPYAPPAVDSKPQPTPKWPPAFCLAMFVVSLLFCCLRIPLLALDLSGDSMGYDPAFEPMIIPGIITSAGIVFFGLIGNALLLGRISWGIPFGVCLILSVAASIGVDIWTLLVSRSLPGYRSTMLGETVSMGVHLFRISLLLSFSIALVMYWNWSDRNRSIVLQVTRH